MELISLLMTVLKEAALKALAWIALKFLALIAHIKGKLFNADKWVGGDIIIKSEPKIEKEVRKEYWEGFNYPFDRVRIRVPLDNRSKHSDVELKELFLRVFVNKVPLKYIIWSKKEKEVGIKISDYTDTELELYAWNTENFVFRKNKEAALDFYIDLPPYVDTRSSEIDIKLIGYAVFDSPFGEFTKKLIIKTKLTKEDWKSE